MNLIQQAKKILDDNWRDGYTIPSARLYPFQWNWDSGFIALGWVHYKPERAMEEIKNMFKGQWKNGLLPHIVFHQPSEDYFPGPDVWKTYVNENAPKNILTSGIVQPPVFGFVLDELLKSIEKQNCDMIQWHAFAKEIFLSIVNFHRYLYDNRDPNNEGLVYIHHNWEAGTDNSPLWDDILKNVNTDYVPDNIANLRKDTQSVNVAHRPTNDNYKRYLALIDLFIRNKYDDKKIAINCPFMVQDVLFNSLLIKSNQGLINVANKLQLNCEEIKLWNKKSVNAINEKLWNEKEGIYYAYDLKSEKQIPIKTSSAFIPMYCGICSEQQIKKLTYNLTENFIKNNQWKLCPSTAADETSFDALKYWRGPVWINVNWIIYQGLMHYGEKELAEKIKKDSLDLLEQQGFYEYFDARPIAENGVGKGLGADFFSWSAALYLNWILSTT